MDLKTLQDLVHQTLAVNNPDAREQLLECLLPLGTIEPAVGLSEYEASTKISLATSLSLTYPAVTALVGETFMQQMASVYVQSHPSDSSNLDDYGEMFPEFVASHISSAGLLPQLAYLADVAQLEWLYHLASRTRPLGPPDISVWQESEEPQALTVRLEAFVTFYESCFPVAEIRRHALSRSDEQLKIASDNFVYVIASTVAGTLVAPCSESLRSCIDCLTKGMSLGQLEEKFPEELPELLPELVRMGLISGFSEC